MNEEEKIHEMRKSLGNYSKEEIIQMCIVELKDKGYVFLKEKFPKTSEDAIDLAVPDLINSGEYIIDPTPFQKKWVIRKNISYKEKRWADKNPNLDKLLWAVIPAILGLIAGLLIARYSNQLESRLKSKEFVELKNRVDSIEKLTTSSRDTTP